MAKQVLIEPVAEKIKFERILRRAGGTLACTIPPELQKAASLKEGDVVYVYMMDDGRLAIELKRKSSSTH